MPKIWTDKEVHKHLSLCVKISNTPNLSQLFVHTSPLSPNRSGWQHFKNSNLAQYGMVYLSMSMTRCSIFRAVFFTDRLRRRKPDETLTSARSLWSDKWAMWRPNMNALRRKHLAFSNTSPARRCRARPQGADKLPCVHKCSHTVGKCAAFMHVHI